MAILVAALAFVAHSGLAFGQDDCEPSDPTKAMKVGASLREHGPCLQQVLQQSTPCSSCKNCNDAPGRMFINQMATCGLNADGMEYLRCEVAKNVRGEESKFGRADGRGCSCGAIVDEMKGDQACRTASRSGDTFTCHMARRDLKTAYCESNMPTLERLAKRNIKTAQEKVNHFCADHSSVYPGDRCEDSSKLQTEMITSHANTLQLLLGPQDGQTEPLSAGHMSLHSGMFVAAVGLMCVAVPSSAAAILSMLRYSRTDVSVEPLLQA